MFLVGSRKALLAGICWSMLVLTGAVHAKTLVGSVDGDAHNDMGNLNYKLPLQVPAGVQGISPVLGLKYSTSSKSGFSLYGTSVITRCSASEKIDGFTGSVSFTDTDRYCLDGQRLVVTNGVDGGVASTYSPYQKDYSKVTSVGGVQNKPASWEVRTKEGYIVRYGMDQTAVDAQDKGIYRWYISSKEDRFGNTVNYHYKDLGNRRVLDNIEYSMHKVQLSYKALGFATKKYEYGSAYTDNYVLDSVSILTDGVLRRSYQLGYREVGQAKTQRLTDIKLCDGQNNCTQPTRFSWHEPANSNPMYREDKLIFSGGKKFINYQQVDVTGDGQPEVCYYNPNGSVNCGGKSSGVGKRFQFAKEVAGTLQFHDLNFDGYADYCLTGYYSQKLLLSDFKLGGEGVYCGLNRGDGSFARATQWSSYTINKNEDVNKFVKTFFVDFNNDKYTDLCSQTRDGLSCWLNNKANQFSERRDFNIRFARPKQSSLVDIDGDGQQDICGLTGQGYSCYLNTSTANTVQFSGRKNWSSHAHFVSGANGAENIYESLRVTDFNNDGLSDVCYFGGGHIRCGFNTGTQLTTPTPITSLAVSSDGGWGPINPPGDDDFDNATDNMQMLDVNQDGHVDICALVTEGSYNCAYNQGNGTVGAMQQYAQFDPMMDIYTVSGYGDSSCSDVGDGEQCGNVRGSAKPITYADVNGDAKVDVCYHSRSGVSCAVSEASEGENLLKAVTTPFKETEFEYAVLSDTDNYRPYTETKQGMLNVTPSLLAVKAVVTDNAAGGKNRLSYQYEGLRYDREDGMRAFAKIIKTNDAKNEVTESYFHQEGKLNGRASQSLVKVGGQLVSDVTYTYDLVEDGLAYEVRTTDTLSQSYDLDGTPLKTHTESFSHYDAFGNPQTVTETTTAGGESYQLVTQSIFENDTATWLLGKPTQVTTTHSNASGSISKVVTFAYGSKGELKQKVTEPSHPLSLTTLYDYDRFGNKIKVTTKDKTGKSRTSSTDYHANGLVPKVVRNALGHTETHVYDNFCQKPLSSTGPNGLTTQWQYDGLCQAVLETRADGTTTRTTTAFSEGYQTEIGFVDTSKYKVTTQSTGTPASTVYFDALGNKTRTQKVGFNGKTVLEDFQYNARGLSSRYTLPYYEGMFAGDNTAWIETEYDALGRQVKQTRPTKGGSLSAMYAYSGQSATTTDARGERRTVVKNVQGEVASVTEPDGSTVRNTYDAMGNLTHVYVNGRENSVMTYDLFGNKATMRDASMGAWEYRYNAFGELYWQKDAKGQITQTTHDDLGRVITRTSADENVVFVYDTAANGIGKLAREESPTKTVSYSYDALGRSQSTETTIADKSFEQTLTYDPLSRVSKVSYPNGVDVQRKYNDYGYLKAISMPKDQLWTPDLLGLEKAMNAYMRKVEELNKEATEYERQAWDLINKAHRARWAADRLIRSANYDTYLANRLLSYASSYERAAGYWYRKAASFRSKARHYYSYMGGNYVRLVAKYSNGWVRYYGSRKRGKKRYTYTLWLKGFFSWNAWPRYVHGGKLFNQYAARYEGYARNYQYWASNYRSRSDQLKRDAAADRREASELYKTARQYYADARVLTDKLREVQNKIRSYEEAVDTIQANLDAYNADAADGEIILWSATDRDASDRLTGQIYGNGILTRHEYDNLTGRLDRIHSEFGDKQLRNVAFEYNANDSVTLKRDSVTGLEQHYDYDAKDQLISMYEREGSRTQHYSYAYDAFGNMTHKSNAGDMYYDEGNRLTRLERKNGSVATYTYDANGNQTKGAGRSIIWTSFNKARSVVSNNGQAVTSFNYGANQERATQTVMRQGDYTEKTYYAGGGYELVTNTKDDSEQFRINLYVGKELVGVYIKTLKGGNPELDRLRYFHKDALGSVDMISDIDGNIVARQGYTPFGERRQQVNSNLKEREITNFIQDEHQGDVSIETTTSNRSVSVETNRGFTGHEHLDHNGLINMNARLYDPETGRFLSADIYIQEPNLLLSHNRYIYVMNNPLKYTDPSGHFWNFIVGAIISYVASQSDNPYIRTIGMVVGGALMGGTFGGETLFGNAIAHKMTAGFVMGGIQGGDLKSAITGAISAGLSYGIGHGGADGGSLFGNLLGNAAAHGVVQGIIAEASGGDFRSGFAAGFVGHVSGAVVGSIGGSSLGAVIGRTTVAAVFGGLAAEATGGNFEDGAFQAAMVHLFNYEGLLNAYKAAQASLFKNAPTAIGKAATKWHFEGRAANNRNLPTYDQAIADDSQWELLSPDQSIFHDNGIGNPEYKFIHPDGREAVFNGDTYQLVTDPRYVGTYNYVNPAPMPSHWYDVVGWNSYIVRGIGHGITDVLPYGVGGNVRGAH